MKQFLMKRGEDGRGWEVNFVKKLEFPLFFDGETTIVSHDKLDDIPSDFEEIHSWLYSSLKTGDIVLFTQALSLVTYELFYGYKTTIEVLERNEYFNIFLNVTVNSSLLKEPLVLTEFVETLPHNYVDHVGLWYRILNFISRLDWIEDRLGVEVGQMVLEGVT